MVDAQYPIIPPSTSVEEEVERALSEFKDFYQSIRKYKPDPDLLLVTDPYRPETKETAEDIARYSEGFEKYVSLVGKILERNGTRVKGPVSSHEDLYGRANAIFSVLDEIVENVAPSDYAAEQMKNAFNPVRYHILNWRTESGIPPPEELANKIVDTAVGIGYSILLRYAGVNRDVANGIHPKDADGKPASLPAIK